MKNLFSKLIKLTLVMLVTFTVFTMNTKINAQASDYVTITYTDPTNTVRKLNLKQDAPLLVSKVNDNTKLASVLSTVVDEYKQGIWVYNPNAQDGQVLSQYQAFVDTPDDMAHLTSVKWLASKSISLGWAVNGEKEYRPYEAIARSDMAAFIYRFANIMGYATAEGSQSKFSDISEQVDHYGAVYWLAEQGISTGWYVGDTQEYRPYDFIARADMAAFIYRLSKKLGLVNEEEVKTLSSIFVDLDGVEVDSDHYKGILWMEAKGITEGWDVNNTKEYRPFDFIARADMAAFIERLSRLLTEIDTTGDNQVDDNAYAIDKDGRGLLVNEKAVKYAPVDLTENKTASVNPHSENTKESTKFYLEMFDLQKDGSFLNPDLKTSIAVDLNGDNKADNTVVSVTKVANTTDKYQDANGQQYEPAYTDGNGQVEFFKKYTPTTTTEEKPTEITTPTTEEKPVEVKKYTVTVKSNNNAFGTVDVTEIKDVPENSVVTVSGNTITVNGKKVTATAKANTNEFTYAFKSWDKATNTKITANTTITATFTQTDIRMYYQISGSTLNLRTGPATGYSLVTTSGKNAWNSLTEGECYFPSEGRDYDSYLVGKTAVKTPKFNNAKEVTVNVVNKVTMPENSQSFFEGIYSLKTIKNANNLDFSKVKNASRMFKNCFTFTGIGTNWNTSNITNMSYMFYNVNLKIDSNSFDKWNTSNVTDMSYMFGHKDANNYLILNTGTMMYNAGGNVGETSGYYNTTNLSKIAKWDVSKVTNMTGMFGLEMYSYSQRGGNSQRTTTITVCANVNYSQLNTWKVTEKVKTQSIFVNGNLGTKPSWYKK